MIDCWLSSHGQHGWNGCPQADGEVERKLSGINRELKEMGPQADEVRIQVSINDDWLLIIRTSFILSGAHQATQVFDDWWLIIDDWCATPLWTLVGRWRELRIRLEAYT